jgi:AraC-like DNA-binding protein
MKPSFEKLLPPDGSSIRCFNREVIERPANWHYHPEVELTFVEWGTGTRYVGDHIDLYQAGDLVLVGENLPHHWSSDEFRGAKYDRHPALVVQFLPSAFGDMLASPEMTPIRELLERARRGIWFGGETCDQAVGFVRKMQKCDALGRLIGLLQCLQALAASRDGTLLASESYSPTFRRKSQARLHRVLEFIHEHVTDASLTQAKIAAFAEMTPSAFSRYFRQATEKSVVEYVNDQRVALAARLLVETSDSVQQIGQRAGFENSSHFNRQFRQLKGTNPRTYRAQYYACGELAAHRRTD